MMQSDDDGHSKPIQPIDSSLNGKIVRSRETDIHAADVLCGRGKTSFNHAGNKKFRDAVSAALDDYMKVANRLEKSLVVHSIVDAIHGAGGRFLKKDFRSGKWYELSDKQGKEKVGHAIRDAVSSHENKKGKARKQKVGLKAPPVARPKDSTDSGSSGTEQTRSVYENLASLPQSAVISAAAAVATAPTVGKYDSPKSNDNSHERQFLAEIDEMLGPLPPNAEDPMEPFLRRGRL